MRIPALNVLVGEELKKYKLNDKTVVIDGQNFLYNLYEISGIPFEFGVESDRYAKYLRDYLENYKKANVKCFFILKGGHADHNKRMSKPVNHGKNYWRGQKDCFYKPILMKNVYEQVLEDMGFEYVISQKESIYECIALGQQLSCPVISFDTRFCFFGVDYIPYTKNDVQKYGNRKEHDRIRYNKTTGDLECEIFRLGLFLKKYNITEEKLALFIVLTDEDIFPKNFFLNFFNLANIPPQSKKRLIHLLAYLSRNQREKVLNMIFEHISDENKEIFLSKEQQTRNFIRNQETIELSTYYFTNRDEVEINEADPKWFEKGIALKHIAVPFVNLYLHKAVIASSCIEDYDQENSLILSLDIIKYAYDLLKNFDGTEIRFCYRSDASMCESETIVIDYSIPKPEYEANICVFENGWQNIQQLNLFQHFITETLHIFDFNKLEAVPEDARLLMIALVYFARKKNSDTKIEIYGILLSYIMLRVVFEKTEHNSTLQEIPESNKPLLDSLTDMTLVTKEDCMIAEEILKKYFTYAHSAIFAEFLHPLVEFQHCLQQLNCLNKLCGSPFKPTFYEKTYNGTFVYQIAEFMHKQGTHSLQDILNPAGTVLAFFNGMVEIYDSIMF